jgi:hypothetical protein
MEISKYNHWEYCEGSDVSGLKSVSSKYLHTKFNFQCEGDFSCDQAGHASSDERLGQEPPILHTKEPEFCGDC